MRLIDADKVDFGKVFIGESDFAKDTREAAQKLINEQPTAYDADKVIQQLEKYVECDICSLRRDGCITPYCERCGAAGALEIVKAALTEESANVVRRG